MTTTEHLTLILAYCERNLALAEKRTPGKWNTQVRSYQVQTNDGGIGRYVAEMLTFNSHERDADAAFIAACAGGAEAGWRATIAAITGLQAVMKLIYRVQNDYDEDSPQWWIDERQKVDASVSAILAAYPEELIK